ncbi:MAG: GNAT family N-acetyltransferase, partial [Thermoplasmata archaeon]|nr:GNAT family N-acetyltransferase [Thermoplasmata archaeon]
DTWRTTYRDLLPTPYLDSLSYAQREDLWAGVLARPAGVHIFVARELGGPVVAFATAGPPRERIEGYLGELRAVYVRESHQRRGIGTGLLTAIADALIEEGIDSMYTWVLAENSATRFYERRGGRRFDERTVDIAGQPVGEIAFGWTELVGQILRRDVEPARPG